MSNDNLQKLHSSLSKIDSNFTRTLDEFKADMQDESKRSKLHSNLSKIDSNFNRSYDEFSSDMGFNAPVQPLSAQDKLRIGSFPTAPMDLKLEDKPAGIFLPKEEPKNSLYNPLKQNDLRGLTQEKTDKLRPDIKNEFIQGGESVNKGRGVAVEQTKQSNEYLNDTQRQASAQYDQIVSNPSLYTGEDFNAIFDAMPEQKQYEEWQKNPEKWNDRPYIQQVKTVADNETGFWSTGIGDAIQALNAGGAAVGGGLSEFMHQNIEKPLYGWMAKPNSRMIWGRIADSFFETQEYSSSAAGKENTVDDNGQIRQKDFVDYFKDGDYTGGFANLGIGALESAPTSAVAIGASAMGAPSVGLAIIGAQVTGQRKRELDKYNPELSELQKTIIAYGSGAIEAGSELLGDIPIGKMLGKIYQTGGSAVANHVMSNSVEGIIKATTKQMRNASILWKAPLSEGGEEFASGVGNYLLDSAMGIQKFNFKEMMTDSGKQAVYGAVAGGGFGLVGAPGVVRNQKVAKQLETLKSNYDKANSNLQTALQGSNFTFDGESIITRPFAQQQEILAAAYSATNLTDAQKTAIRNYMEAGNSMNAALVNVGLTNIELLRKKAASYKQVTESVNQTTGTIDEMTLQGTADTENYKIKGGKVAFDNEGKVDLSQSDETIYYYTGAMNEDGTPEVSMITPDNITAVQSSDPKQLLQQSFSEIEAEEFVRSEFGAGMDVMLNTDMGQQPGTIVAVVPEGLVVNIQGLETVVPFTVAVEAVNSVENPSASLDLLQGDIKDQVITPTYAPGTTNADGMVVGQQDEAGNYYINDVNGNLVDRATPEEMEMLGFQTSPTPTPQMGTGTDISTDELNNQLSSINDALESGSLIEEQFNKLSAYKQQIEAELARRIENPTPSAPTLPIQEETAAVVTPSYPVLKDGTPDFKNMTDAQSFEYLKETEGEQEAASAINMVVKNTQKDLADNLRAIDKFNKDKYARLQKAKSVAEIAGIKAQLKADEAALNAKQTELQTKLDGLKALLPQVAAVEAPVTPVQETAPKGNLRPEIAQLQKEKEAEKELLNRTNSIDLNNIDTDNYIYITHQTDNVGLDGILSNGFDIRNGLNGTTLFGNKESIQNAINSINEGHGHRGANKLLVYAFPKEKFGNVRQLDEISDQMHDEGIYTMPSEYIFGVHTQTEDSGQLEVDSEEITSPTLDSSETLTPAKKTVAKAQWTRRLNALGDYLSVEDFVLRAIAGGLKFKWTGESFNKGLGDELGFANNEAERSYRESILSNKGKTPKKAEDVEAGVTPHEFAQQIWDEYGDENNMGRIPGLGEYQDIYNAILETAAIPKNATHALEMSEAIHPAEDTTTFGFDKNEVVTFMDLPVSEAEMRILENIPDDILASFLGISTFTPEQFNMLDGLLKGYSAQIQNDYDHTKQSPESTSAETSPNTVAESPTKGSTEERTADAKTNVNTVDSGQLTVDSEEKPSEQKRTKTDSSVLSPITNGTIVTYNGQEYTVNGLYADGLSVDLEDAKGKTIHEEVAISELNHVVDTNEMIDATIASQDPNVNPTESQKEAGNYKKAHIAINGMEISVENPVGSVRSGKDANGKEWSNEMFSHYGYFKGTVGRDGDHVDTFIKSNTPEDFNGKVYVIDQVHVNGPKSGLFDESKVMLGYASADEAASAYMDNYDKDWNGLSDITEVSVDDFKTWLYDGKKQAKPFADYKETKKAVQGDKRGQKGTTSEVTPILSIADHATATVKKNEEKAANNKISQAQQEADAALQDFMDAFNDLQGTNLGIADNSAEKQAKMLMAGTKMVGAFTKLGLYKFADIVYQIGQKGIQITEELLSALKKSYGAFAAESEIDELDDMKTVRQFTINDLQEKKTEDLTQKTDNLPKNDVSLNDQKFIKEHIIFGTIPKTNNNGQQPRSTEIIESETAVIETVSAAITNSASNVGSDQQRAGEVKEQASEQIKSVESLLSEVENKLANLRLTDKSYSTDGIAADYPINVLAKGEIKKDLTKYIKAVAEITGLAHDTDKKGKTEIVNVNIAPAGGDASFFLWSKTNPEHGVYVSIPYDPDYSAGGGYDNYKVMEDGWRATILWRVVNKAKKYDGSNRYMPTNVTAQEMAETLLKGINTELKSKGLTEEQVQEINQNAGLKITKTTNDNGSSKQRVLQGSNKRLSGTASPSLFDGMDDGGIGNNVGKQSEPISGTNGEQQQPAGRERTVLPGNAELSDTSGRGRTGSREGVGANAQGTERTGGTGLLDTPALVPFNAEDNDTQSFNQSRKYDDNIAAIETLITLVKEKRQATPDEKTTLSKYVGFGGLKDIVLNPESADGWKESNLKYRTQVKRIVELASEFDKVTGITGSLASIKGSILNAHFTSSSVIRPIYEGLSKLGFKGGRMLEPSAGIGNFVTYAPDRIKANSNITAVELDNLTGTILKYLHDDVNVKVSGIQDAQIPNNSQDLVISNVPFGNYKIFDKAFKGDKAEFQNRIHNYFFAKAVDMAREGGIIAFVTSKGVMDAQGNEALRKYLNDNTEFLGAVRLPNNAFKNNANTEVVTDIIFLKKNTTGTKNNPDFVTIKQVEATHKDGEKQMVNVNNYFVENPQNMLGNIVAGGLYSREDYTVENKTGYDLSKTIKNALPAGVYEKVNSKIGMQANDSQQTIDAIKEGNIEVTGGRVVRKEEGQLKDISINEPQGKIEHYIRLRNALMNLIYSEYLGKPDSELNAIRKQLNTEYDTFVKKHGKLSKNAVKIAKQDADGFNVLSLEVADKKDGKADIFRQRTIQPIQNKLTADSVDEAIVISLYENASIDVERIAQLLNITVTEVLQQAKGKIFEQPEGGFVTREEYLSGNVKAKLRQAQEAVDKGFTEFSYNVEQLLDVIPADIPAMHIEARLGSRWIPQEVYTEFARYLFNTPNAKVIYQRSIDAYSNNGRLDTVEAQSKWGTARRNGTDILLDALHINPAKIYDTYRENGQDVRVLNVEETKKAVEKYEDIRKEFEAWVYRTEERRTLLARIYNEKYNTTVKRSYNGDHLNIAGINGVTLRAHQKDAIWMLLQNNGGIIDHLVGAGKTYIMVAGTMEMKRTGIAKKPMIMALKSTIPQIIETYREAYPMAKILAPMEKDFTKENRKKLFSQIANNEWDVIIMSHENYGKIPHEADIQRDFLRAEMQEIEDERAELEAQGEKQALKGLEIRLKNLEARLEKISDIDKDNSLTFEQMGIDHIMVDESQQFKNLSYVTKQRGVAGLSKAEGSKRAFNLFIGIRYLQQKYGEDKGTTFLSGTPISNSMVEMYLLLKYLRPAKMNELGFNSFDAWATTFASPNSDIEMTVTGDIKAKTRFREFINVPELSMLYTEIADIRTDANTPLDKPKMKGGGYTVENITMSDDQREYGQRLMEFARTKDGSHIGMTLTKNQETAAMLLATNLSSKMAIDMRLIDPSYSYDPNGKIGKLVDNVERIYNETAEYKGTQLIFSDLGTPKNKANKTATLRDYMEDEMGTNLDTLNEIFGNPEEAGYKYPSMTVIRERLTNILELTSAEIDGIITESENAEEAFNVYAEVKKRLVEKGVPEEQIVFIHDYNSSKAKEKLFKQVQNGEIRIVLGSTQKLGTGVNVQHRVVAVHHLDVPWTPASMEQRNGRAIRQGNWVAKKYLNNELPIYAYATERTLDAYKYQLLQTKQRFLDQVKSGEVDERTVRESDGDSDSGVGYAELVAMLSGNKDILLKSKLEQQVQNLTRSKRNFLSEVYEAQDRVQKTNERIPLIEENISKTTENVNAITNAIQYDKDGKMIVADINGETLVVKNDKGKVVPTERIDYGKRAAEIAKAKLDGASLGNIVKLFSQNGIDFYGSKRTEWIKNNGKSVETEKRFIVLRAKNGQEYSVNYSETAGILLNNIQKTIEGIPSILSGQQAVLDKSKKDIVAYQEILDKGTEWEKEPELQAAITELQAVTRRLDELSTPNQPQPPTDGEPVTDDKIRIGDLTFTIGKESFVTVAIAKNKKGGEVAVVRINEQLSNNDYAKKVKPLIEKYQGDWNTSNKVIVFYDTKNVLNFKMEVEDAFPALEDNYEAPQLHTGTTLQPTTAAEQAAMVEQLFKTGLTSEVRMVTPEEIEGIIDGTEQKHAVYHGSPHSFDQFSLDHIGTGEGAQAYGHGLYFTDKKDIAKDYAEKLADVDSEIEKLNISDSAKEYLYYAFTDTKKPETAISILRESIKNIKDSQKSDKYKTEEWYKTKIDQQLIDVEEAIKSIPDLKQERNLYSVELHEGKEPSEYDYLRWDKPVTENQRNKVYSQLEKEGIQLDKNRGVARLKDTDLWQVVDFNGVGRKLYQNIALLLKSDKSTSKFELSKQPDSDKAASELLLRAGIDGIQYPANYTTGKANETDFNYVVFDPSAISIKEKVQFMRTPTGTIYGFVKNGVVYLNSTTPNLNTPIHEFGHLWVDAIEGSELFEKGKALVMETPYWTKVNNDPNYSGLSENARVKEAMAAAIGDKGEAVKQNLGLFARIKTWINDVWARIGAKFGIQNLTSEQIHNLTFNDFTDIAVSELLSGENLAERNKNTNFETPKNNNGSTEKTRLDNRRTMASEPERLPLGTVTSSNAVGKTIAGTTTSNPRTGRTGDAKSQGKYWNKSKGLKQLAAQAKADGTWIEDITTLTDGKEHFANGTENNVYHSKDGYKVIKVNNLLFLNDNDLEFAYTRDLNYFFDRISAHNALFPEDAYNILGFTENEAGQVCIVMEQPYISSNVHPTIEEIEADLAKGGFTKTTLGEGINQGLTGYTNGIYELTDVKPLNVLKGKNGKFHYIDLDICRTIQPATITIDGVERSTTNSNGTPIHSNEEGIRNFWKWFGDSKVVDAEGRPLVVYHGTPFDFNEFKIKESFVFGNGLGHWFTTNKEISTVFAEGNNNLSAYLKADNLKGIKGNVFHRFMYDRVLYVGADAKLRKQSPKEEIKLKHSNSSLIRPDFKLMRENLISEGYDGLFLNNISSEGRIVKSPQYVVFNSNQIKSATGNDGGFDGNDPDIRFQVGPEKPEYTGGDLGDFAQQTVQHNQQQAERTERVSKMQRLQEIMVAKSALAASHRNKEITNIEYSKQMLALHEERQRVLKGLPDLTASATANEDTINDPKPTLTPGLSTTQLATQIADWNYRQTLNKALAGTANSVIGGLPPVDEDTQINNELLRVELDQRLGGFFGRLVEGWQDNIRSVRIFQELLKEKGTKVSDFNNFHMQYTAIQGKNDAHLKDFGKRFMTSINHNVKSIQQFTNYVYRDLENYVFLKHGIERNEYMRQAAATEAVNAKLPPLTKEQIDGDIDGSLQDEYKASYDQFMEEELANVADKDYSGLFAVAAEIFAKENGIKFNPAKKGEVEKVQKLDEFKAVRDQLINDFIANFEQTVNEANIPGAVKGETLTIDGFWSAINAASNYSLDRLVTGGIENKLEIDDLKARYKYYVPLRGHEVEAEKVWQYEAPDNKNVVSKAIMQASGRKSRAEHPFAYIIQMAQTSINKANRNHINQTMLRLARQDKSGLMSVSEAWYVLTGTDPDSGKEIWTETEPEYSEDHEMRASEISAWNEKMVKLEEQGKAKRFKKGLRIGGLFIKPKQKRQHAISVYEDGVVYQVYINGNPRVSQAINELNGTIFRIPVITPMTRFISSMITSRSPQFMLTNGARDFAFASSILPSKEGAKYTGKFLKNYPVAMAILANNATFDFGNDKAKYKKYLREFEMNGGETGYSHLLELQDIEKDLRKEQKGKNYLNPITDLGLIVDAIDAGNKVIENSTRLAVYISSRESGRSVERSVSDSKEVTLNFNRRGSGIMGAAHVQSIFMFVNAGVQALANFGHVYKMSPVKMSATIGLYAAVGYMLPMIISMIGDDDDEKEYMNMTDWERQTNLCIPTGNGFAKIPLPQEMRVFFKLGDELYKLNSGRTEMVETAMQTLMSAADMIPISPLGTVASGEIGDFGDLQRTITPDALRGIAELATNTNFMGGQIYDKYKAEKDGLPGYQKARLNRIGEARAPQSMVGFTKWLDSFTGGDGTQKGSVSLNPDVVNHLAKSYLGGMYSLIAEGGKSFTKRFYTSNADIEEKNTTVKDYYKRTDAADEVIRQEKGYWEQKTKGEITDAEYNSKVNANKLKQAYEIHDNAVAIQNIERILKTGELNADDELYYKNMSDSLKREVIGIKIK